MKKRIFQSILTLSTILSSLNSWAFQPEKLVENARLQIGQTLYYDPAYTALKYPMGDVPLSKRYVPM